ncbi:hypothetical protein CAG70_04520 [Photobacterium halotolerans]|uniref:Chloramphenicol phosphotransferase n=2 Tax=Photobacterium halotolerans TaxID=265726 RepID=A0A7X4XVY8_9GAMM|nr:hypothetical protein [Photobacterium halotolerans]NAW64058.1 hypothetical protein [Photobacterium halotolerans]NAX46257.1 hypothetical protein [Photobacterium halotolerans]
MGLIFLNGPSSAGKSSIARELQHCLDDYYLHLGIDTFIAMMPDNANALGESDQKADGFYWQTQLLQNQPVKRISSGSFGKKVNTVYRTTVRHMIDSGLKVSVDDVIDGETEMAIWQSVLAGCNCLYIGVTCSDESLRLRERKRGDRLPGSAIEQASRVHQGISYDLTVNTDRLSASECAETIKRYIALIGS